MCGGTLSFGGSSLVGEGAQTPLHAMQEGDTLSMQKRGESIKTERQKVGGRERERARERERERDPLKPRLDDRQ